METHLSFQLSCFLRFLKKGRTDGSLDERRLLEVLLQPDTSWPVLRNALQRCRCDVGEIRALLAIRANDQPMLFRSLDELLTALPGYMRNGCAYASVHHLALALLDGEPLSAVLPDAVRTCAKLFLAEEYAARNPPLSSNAAKLDLRPTVHAVEARPKEF